MHRLVGTELLLVHGVGWSWLTTVNVNARELGAAGVGLSCREALSSGDNVSVACWIVPLVVLSLFVDYLLASCLAGQFPAIAGWGPLQFPHLAGMCWQTVPGLDEQSTTQQICSFPSWGPAQIKQHG